MHRLLALLLVLLIAPAMTGCGPSVSSKEMGTVLYKIPHVQGADKPYELHKTIMPSAGTNVPNSPDGEGTKTGHDEVEKEGQH